MDGVRAEASRRTAGAGGAGGAGGTGGTGGAAGAAGAGRRPGRLEIA
ncbi:hypothetical protein [Nonomuraea sp. NPDC049725]